MASIEAKLVLGAEVQLVIDDAGVRVAPSAFMFCDPESEDKATSAWSNLLMCAAGALVLRHRVVVVAPVSRRTGECGVSTAEAAQTM